MKKLAATIIALIFLVSLLSIPVLSLNSLSVNAFWVDNNGSSISVFKGQDKEIKVFVSSTEDFKLWIDVLDKNQGKVKEVVNGLSVSSNINTPYLQNFAIPTGGLTLGDYFVRVSVVNSNESEDVFLNLKVSQLIVPPLNIDKNHAPVLPEILDQDFYEGQDNYFNMAAFDSDLDEITFNFERKITFGFGGLSFDAWLPFLPSGAEFNEQTGYFTWKPGYDYIDHPNLERNLEFRFWADDGEDVSNYQYVNLKVHDVNRDPSFVNKFKVEYVVNEEELLKIGLAAKDNDNDKLYFKSELTPKGASLIDNGDGTAVFTWVPKLNQQGIYSVIFLVDDGVYGGFDYHRIVVRVNNTDLPELPEEPKFQCNDGIDNDGDGLIDFEGYTDPTGYEYLADPGCTSFSDDNEYNSPQLPEEDPVDVNNAPTAVNDAAETLENNAVAIPVLSNDFDVDNDTLHISAVSLSENGVVEVVGDEIVYTPDQDFAGIDNFKYAVSDGELQDTGFVSVTVVEYDTPETPEEPEIPEYHQCEDDLDNDGDGLIDYPNDPGCDSLEDDDEYNAPEIPEEPEQPEEPQVSYTNIKFKSAFVVWEGDYAYVNTYLLNNGDKDLEDLRVTAAIYSLEVKGSGSVFNLDQGENRSVNVYVPLPYGANSGYYIVKITVKNSWYHDSVYRLLYLN